MPAQVLTGDPVLGINTYFALGSATTPSTVQDISDFLTAVDPSEDTDEQDATTFRRPMKRMLAGQNNVGYSLSGYFSKEAHQFFAPLRGKTDVAFEYGPGGDEDGEVKISGTCTVLSYSDPAASVDGVNAFTVELRIISRTDGVFAGTTAAAASASGLREPVKRAGLPAKRSAAR